MSEYVMTTKNGNGLVFKKHAGSLEEAKQLFRKLKQMTKEDFNKIFVVTEVKK